MRTNTQTEKCADSTLQKYVGGEAEERNTRRPEAETRIEGADRVTGDLRITRGEFDSSKDRI